MIAFWEAFSLAGGTTAGGGLVGIAPAGRAEEASALPTETVAATAPKVAIAEMYAAHRRHTAWLIWCPDMQDPSYVSSSDLLDPRNQLGLSISGEMPR